MNLFKALNRLSNRERGLADLSRWLGLPESELRPWLSNSPAWARGYDYRRFTIPKRRGATGFVRGRSIVDNARPHVNRAVVINVDLADFFPSITAERVTAAWRGLGWGAEAAAVLTAICTLDGRLPQGAPTSPALSNLV